MTALNRRRPKQGAAASQEGNEAFSVSIASPGADRPAPHTEGRVIIVGISGGLGRLLTRRLHRTETVEGVDLRPFRGKPKDVTVRLLDYRKKKIADIFRTGGPIKAVYHLGAVFSGGGSAAEAHEYNLSGTARLLELCDQHQVPRVVVLSSCAVYGALPNNDQYLREDATLLGGLRYPQIRALVEMDMLAQTFFWKNQYSNTIILRPVNVVGPTVSNAFTRLLHLSSIPRLMGFDPLVQLVHEEDVVQALELSLRTPGARGVFNLAGPGASPFSTIVRELEKPSYPIPHVFIDSIMEGLHRAGLSSFRGPETDYLRFPCMVDDARARRLLGYRPRFGLRETIRSAVYTV